MRHDEAMNAVPSHHPRPAGPSVSEVTNTLRAAASVPGMDRQFIEHNRIVERYISGLLPPRGAVDFERFCAEHPELLEELGLPERVNAGLRLMEAGGLPEPWREKPRPWWSKLPAVASIAGAALILAITAAVLGSSVSQRNARIATLQKQVIERPLLPATSTRPVILVPSRNGPVEKPALTIGGAVTELADFKVDMSWSKFTAFRVLIDRQGQGRVAAISNLNKDSNGHLRIALNSSALGPGSYNLTMDGLTWKGDPVEQAWISFEIGSSR